MFGINWRWTTVLRLFMSLMAVIMVLGVTSCGSGPEPPPSYSRSEILQTQPTTNIEEVAPPPVIQELRQILEVYQPQVTILSPQQDELFDDNTVTVDIAVEDLPLFKDPQLELGPHLEVILDNQSYTRIYDLKEPLVLADLPPGTHTLRVFADRPWDESFKNEGSYAETTFHIFTKTEENNPSRALPLLTYNSPDGSYGAEPILLDFYLRDAPLHLVAQEYPDDDILDWRIRCTINGESFYLDQWQSIYIKGFQPGKNWVQLEFIDELGRAVKNEFNNTVRLITYQPNGQDTKSRLLRGELAAAVAQAIVDPNYTPPAEAPAPSEVPIEEPETTSPEQSIEAPEAQPSEAIDLPVTTPPEETIPQEAQPSEAIDLPVPTPPEETIPQEAQPSEAIDLPVTTPPEETIAVPQEAQPSEAIAQPETTSPEPSIEAPATESQSQNISDETTILEPASEETPTSETPDRSGFWQGLLRRFQRTAPDDASPEVISPSASEPASEETPTSETPDRSGFFWQGLLRRFRRTAPEVTPAPTISDDASPEVISPSVEEQTPQTASEETPAIEEQTPPTASEETLAIEGTPSTDQAIAPPASDAPASEGTPSVDSFQPPVLEPTDQETEAIAPPATDAPASEGTPSVDSFQPPVLEPTDQAIAPPATDAPATEMTPSVELEQRSASLPDRNQV